jgi:signal transduction histidine kinase
MAAPHVLLVDDDPALLDALTDALKLRIPGITVEPCDAALTAISKLREESFDLLVSDVKMPGVDGLELLSESQMIAPAMPVLLITGHGDTDIAVKALRAGAFDLIQKPLDRDYVTAAINRAFETVQLRRELAAKQKALELHAMELEERVHERTKDLEAALQAKDEFLGLVSHELRTPMTVMIGNIDILYRHEALLDAEDKATAWSDLRIQSQRLLGIIENLLVLARDEYGASGYSQDLALSEVIAFQIERQRKLDDCREISLRCDEEAYVFADRTHLDLILSNFMSNAAKYSEACSPIDVSVTTAGDQVVLAVADRGPGIKADEISLIFEPFFRSKDSALRTPGMGIGLSVCKRLAEIHGGSITVEAREGGGSVFAVHLPLAIKADF